MATQTRWAVTLLVVAIVCGVASSAFAQTRVRVTRDGAIIWGRDARVPLTTLKSGTELEVVAREGDWYVVRIPPEQGGRGETGLIAVTRVETIAGDPLDLPAGADAATPRRAPGSAPQSSTRRAPAGIGTEVFGFGQVGYDAFLARDTFNAILGTAGLPAFGGGAHVNLFGRWFIDGSIEWMAKTGQRVAVAGGQAFPLGIADRVRLVPIALNVGYRLRGRTVTPYFGGGAGLVFYRETSDFADPGEDVSDRFTSYQGVVGFEVGSPRSPLRTAVEVQFSTVPNAIGSSGASAAFNEHNLGGFQLRLKILAGR